MKRILLTNCLILMLGLSAQAQNADQPPPPPGGQGVPGGPGGFGGGGPGGGGFMGGGPPGMGQHTQILKKFDKDGDKKLNKEERTAAREYLAKEGNGRRRGPGGFGNRGNQEPPSPGEKLTPADVKSYAGAPLYDTKVLRTFFLEFEDSDWEKELAEFKNTDVEVPAKLTVDGKTYDEVGVHFRGMSSFMMVGEGRKRSLSISMDEWNKKQDLGGYHTLHLLNSHEDPSFMRVVLYDLVARDFLPTAKANFVRVVINGENWGIYQNEQQVNKDFLKEWFGTSKGSRWKVQGSPGGRGSLAYLGNDPAPYKQIYSIKTKDDKKAWDALIKLCRVLNETPADKLEEALAPILDIDGALRFLAVENALINDDGYWIRTSDYNIYLDEKGIFHILPHDTNEGFAKPGGPGFGGGGFAFGPGMMVGNQMMAQGDKDGNKKLSADEMKALAGIWFDKLDADKAGKINQEQFAARIGEILPMPQGFGPPNGGLQGGRGPGQGGGGPGRRGPGMMAAPLFTALDADKDGSLTREEMTGTFAKWFADWDKDKSGALDEGKLRAGLDGVLPRPNFAGFGRGGPGGPGGGPGGPGGPGGGFGGRGGPGGGGPGGPGGGMQIKGVELDPLAMANDPNKPLISKLLAVPALRAKYLGYVRQVAEKWLDWEKLGPIATEYHELIAADVKRDTRKLESYEDFEKNLTESVGGRGAGGGGPGGPGGGGPGGPGGPGGFGGPGGRETIGIKVFAEQRRAYLMNYKEKKAEPAETPKSAGG